MPAVTVAVPVFNGEALLGEALRCLQGQSLRDIEIIVLDNASTDATAEIAESFARNDPRFRIVRQPFNKGAVGNFLDGIKAAEGEYFAWRAFDDLSDARYFELLHNELERHPTAALAVGTIQSMNVDGGRRRTRAVPKLTGNSVHDVYALLFGSHAAWFYGLWRRPMLLPVYLRTLEIFPDAWGSDHLTLFPFLVGRQITFDEAAVFYQRLKRSENKPRRKELVAVAQMTRIRANFDGACRTFLRTDTSMTGFEKLVLRAFLPFYVTKRSYRLGLLARGFLSESRRKLRPKKE